MTASKILAAIAPVKILSADILGPAAKARSASCVRSPNSAKNVVVNELRIIAFAGIGCVDKWYVFVLSSLLLATLCLDCIRLASMSALAPNRRKATPEIMRIVSMATIDFIQAPAVIQSPAPIVRANTLPVKTHLALCLAAKTSVVKNDLSPIPAMATVANAVVNPATVFGKLHTNNI